MADLQGALETTRPERPCRRIISWHAKSGAAGGISRLLLPARNIAYSGQLSQRMEAESNPCEQSTEHIRMLMSSPLGSRSPRQAASIRASNTICIGRRLCGRLAAIFKRRRSTAITRMDQGAGASDRPYPRLGHHVSIGLRCYSRYCMRLPFNGWRMQYGRRYVTWRCMAVSSIGIRSTERFV